MTPQLRRVLLIVGIGALVLALVLAGSWYFKGGDGEIRSGGVVVGSTAAIGGPFALLDQEGRAVTDEDFRDKYLLIYFGFTHCPDACPMALLAMSQAMERLPPAVASKVQPIFFTVDPDRDTPEQVKLYLENFHASFVGLTGSREQVARAAQAYRVVAQKTEGDTPENYGIAHGTLIYLMGPDGAFLRHFTHTATPAELVDGLVELVPGA